MTREADEVLRFWLDEVGPDGWYGGGEALDAEIAERFGAAIDSAAEGALALWLTYPAGSLAYCVVADQFPRQAFRGSGRAFATDALARGAAGAAIRHGWDLRIDPPARQFFYLPFMHAECLRHQDRSVRLIADRMAGSETGASNLLHARAHREVIRRFGRFPYRNEALGRRDTPAEARWTAAGGYGATVRELQGGPGDGQRQAHGAKEAAA